MLEHQGEHATHWAAICSVAGKIGCSGETLRHWVRQAERMKALEREKRQLRQANEILRKASAYFAVAELDRRSKP